MHFGRKRVDIMQAFTISYKIFAHFNFEYSFFFHESGISPALCRRKKKKKKIVIMYLLLWYDDFAEVIDDLP